MAPEVDGGPDQSEDQPKTKSMSAIMGEGESFPDADETFGLDGSKKRSKLLSHSTVLVFLLVGIAIAVIYVMRLSQGEIESAPGSKEAADRIDAWIKSATGPGTASAGTPDIDSLFGNVDEILTKFSSDQTGNQVPIEYLQRNPFVLANAPSSGGEPVALPGPAVDHEANRRQERLEELQGELANLELQTVIIGRMPVAVINNDLIREGHKIGAFRIQKIQQRSVVLTAEGEVFSLELEQ